MDHLPTQCVMHLSMNQGGDFNYSGHRWPLPLEKMKYKDSETLFIRTPRKYRQNPRTEASPACKPIILLSDLTKALRRTPSNNRSWSGQLRFQRVSSKELSGCEERALKPMSETHLYQWISMDNTSKNPLTCILFQCLQLMVVPNISKRRETQDMVHYTPGHQHDPPVGHLLHVGGIQGLRVANKPRSIMVVL